jgi:NADH-quinone oxidoreductase subunit I
MDTEFELSTDNRFGGLLWDKARLSKSNAHYGKIHPTDAAASDALLAEEKAKVEAKAKAAGETKTNPALTNAPLAASGATSKQ